MLSDCSTLPLELIHPFRIAHGVSHTRHNVLVRIGCGLGEAACVPYRGDSESEINAYVRGLDWRALGWDPERQPQPFPVAHVVRALPAGPAVARAAVDMALHDCWAQGLKQPLFRCLGLDPNRTPFTSQTVAQASPEQMASRAKQVAGPIVKLKLGSDLDLDIARIGAVQEAKKCTIRVDANAGWSVEQAERALPALFELGVELVEQPLAAGDREGLKRLSRLPRRPPLFLDESIEGPADILAHAGLVEGVVIKLAKAGGIGGALEQMSVARALGLEVMLSCMVESSVAVTAAAHIAPLAQKVDLDGPLLIRNDAYRGVTYDRGRLRLPERPGLGLLAKPE